MSNALYKDGTPSRPGSEGYRSGDPGGSPGHGAYCVYETFVEAVYVIRYQIDERRYIFVRHGPPFLTGENIQIDSETGLQYVLRVLDNPTYGKYAPVPVFNGFRTTSISHCSPAVPASLPHDVAPFNPIRANLNLGWNAGARSVAFIEGNGTYTFSVQAPCAGVVTGFNESNTGVGYVEIDHGFYFAGTSYRIIESGATVAGTEGSFTTADVFQVIRHNGTVYYTVNGTLVYTSLVASTDRAVFADASLYSYGDVINDITLISYVASAYATTTLTCAGTLPSITPNINTSANSLKCEGLLPTMTGLADVSNTRVAGTLPSITPTIIASYGDGTHYSILAGSLPEITGHGEIDLIDPSPIFIDGELPQIMPFAVVSGGSALNCAGTLPSITPNIAQLTSQARIEGFLPAITPSIDVSVDNISYVTGLMPAMRASLDGQALPAYFSQGIRASMPRMTAAIEGTATTTTRPTGNTYAPSFIKAVLPTMTALLNSGGTIAATMPAMTASAYGGARIKARMPKMTAALVGTPSGYVTITASLPSMMAALDVKCGSDTTITARMPRMTALLYGGARVVARMPKMTAALEGQSGTVGAVSATMPAMTVALVGYAGRAVAVAASMPRMTAVAYSSFISATMPRMRALLSANDTSYAVTDAYVCTVSAAAKPVTRYTNYPFHSIVRRGAQTLGFGPSGVFVLDGDDDDGTDIAWAIGFGPTTSLPGNSAGDGILKSNDGVYLNGRFGGTLQHDVQVDDGPVYSYEKAAPTAVLNTMRFIPGRGLRGYAWRFAFSGIGAMTAYRAEFLQRSLKRKTRYG